MTIDALEMRDIPGRDLPILMLHEGLGSVSQWRDFPDRVAQATGHRVIAWSREGYGASPQVSALLEPDYMHREADKLPDLLDRLGVDRAHLFGHSDGASIALIAAARFPDRMAGLILEAPHVFVEDITVESIAQIGDGYAANDLGARLGRHHADADSTFWRWNRIWLDPRFRDWNIEALLPEIRAPLLLIQGLDDEYGTMAQLDAIEAVLPHSRRVELAHCGHSPHRDQPEAVLAATARFIEDIDACQTLSSATL